VPISLTGLAEAVLVVPASLPVKSVAELIAYAKANPGVLNYGTTSIGASDHIGVEQLKSITGIRIELVAYTSIANLIGDLVSGRVSVFIAPPGSVLAFVQSGKLRALGVSGNKRQAILPDVPAITETLPEFRASSWYAVMAPARTPADILAKVNTDTRWVLEQPDVKQRLLQSGVEAAASSPEELRAHMQREVESIEKLVQRGALKRGQ